jgi:hypothetical protein
MDFLEKLGKVEPEEKEAAVVWIGQAGFLIKTHLKKVPRSTLKCNT